jgi:hypothetical protein
VGTDKAGWPAKPPEILLARPLVAKPRLELLNVSAGVNPYFFAGVIAAGLTGVSMPSVFVGV